MVIHLALINHIVFIYLPVDGHLDCFYFLPTMNSATMSINAQVCL